MLVDEKAVLSFLDEDLIVPFCQPVRELRTGRLTGFELLARWHHPDLGFILPPALIAVAERSGQLSRLTEQILTKAFEYAAPFAPDFTLAVNISPLQLRDPKLCSTLQAVAAKTGFSLTRLVIEVTETALVESLELAQETIQSLKLLGCKVLLDDFGTGYSSLAYLQNLQFDGLKIDRSFIRGITDVREDRKIVAALIGLGQNLGITTVAEGIESEAQASTLLYLGCELGQGYLYGRPEPLASVESCPRFVSPAAPPRASKEPSLSALESLPFERVAQLQAIYDGAPVGLCYLSRDLRYVSVNRELATIDDVPIVNMLGRRVVDVFPDWAPIFEPILWRGLAGESVKGVEIKRPTRIGGEEEQCVLVSCEPALDEAHEVIGLSLAVVDISEKKRAEKRLIESEKRSRLLLDMNPETPWIMDRNCELLDLGNKWTRITGVRREDLLRMGYMSTVLEEERENCFRGIKAAVAAKVEFDVEVRCIRAGGASFWARVRGRPVLDDRGEVMWYYGSTEDIDEMKRLRELVASDPSRNGASAAA